MRCSKLFGSFNICEHFLRLCSFFLYQALSFAMTFEILRLIKGLKKISSSSGGSWMVSSICMFPILVSMDVVICLMCFVCAWWTFVLQQILFLDFILVDLKLLWSACTRTDARGLKTQIKNIMYIWCKNRNNNRLTIPIPISKNRFWQPNFCCYYSLGYYTLTSQMCMPH
jgi:hypothetical protein